MSSSTSGTLVFKLALLGEFACSLIEGEAKTLLNSRGEARLFRPPTIPPKGLPCADGSRNLEPQPNVLMLMQPCPPPPPAAGPPGEVPQSAEQAGGTGHSSHRTPDGFCRPHHRRSRSLLLLGSGWLLGSCPRSGLEGARRGSYYSAEPEGGGGWP